MTHKTFADALEETANVIERAVDCISRDESAEAELRNLRIYVSNVLELVERNVGIEVAADDLCETSRVFVAGLVSKGDLSRRGQLMREAYLRFRNRLMNARPSEHARRMGIV
jgi:hypothetical protein